MIFAPEVVLMVFLVLGFGVPLAMASRARSALSAVERHAIATTTAGVMKIAQMGIVSTVLIAILLTYLPHQKIEAKAGVKGLVLVLFLVVVGATFQLVTIQRIKTLGFDRRKERSLTLPRWLAVSTAVITCCVLALDIVFR